MTEQKTNHALLSREGVVGHLEAMVFTARRAVPIEGARVIIRSASEGRMHLLAAGKTNAAGRTNPFVLPAVRADAEGSPSPLYEVLVFAGGYNPTVFSGLRVFENKTTIQPAELTPAP